jgi:hypothetical protein
MITEATQMMQGAGIVLAFGALGWWAQSKLMRSEAKPRPEPLTGKFYLPTVSIQPDGSVYLRPDRQRLGGATVAPRLRKEAGR